MAPFTIDIVNAGRERRVAVRGDLDVETVQEFRDALRARVAGTRIVLDVSGVTFMDSTGLSALVRGHMALREAGSELVITRPLGQPVEDCLTVAGLLDALPVEPA